MKFREKLTKNERIGFCIASAWKSIGPSKCQHCECAPCQGESCLLDRLRGLEERLVDIELAQDTW